MAQKTFNLIKLEILETTITPSEANKLKGLIGDDVSYEIEYLGKYPLLREFGMLPMTLDQDLITELTKAFMDQGMNHSKAYDAAFEIANKISKDGQSPTPFVRTAMNEVAFKMSSKKMSKDEVDKMITAITELAKKLYLDGNTKLKVSVPLKYNVYIIMNGKKQKI